MATYDWLIVGAGFTGAVFAERLATICGARVLVIDRRGHVGGNAYDAPNAHGLLVHRYGPHLFHTNSERVWRYLSQFTAWTPYEHRVRAEVEGRLVPVPFNLTSLHALFPDAEAERLERRLVEIFGDGAKVPVLRLREHADADLRALGRFVYENVFLGYTLKQWGRPPDALDPSVTGRVPVFVSRDSRYFQDRHQAMPADGYTPLFEKMLAQPGIDVALHTALADVESLAAFDRVLYTGPLDAFFDYAHGALPYRSLRFEEETHAVEWMQPVGQINHPNEHAYTRVVEQKHLTGQTAPVTTLVREYPEAHVPGFNEPYYPVPHHEHRALYLRYLRDAQQMPSVVTAGRLADYKYYNMDQAVGRALALFDRVVLGRASSEAE